MPQETTLLVLALLFGFYAAWNIGANDVANAMGTSVGSKALTLVKAVFLAALFEFLGAYLFGSYVSHTLQSGIVDTSNLSPKIIVLGMLSALFATGLWLQIASYFGLPVSTTHSIVGAIIGFGITAGGMDTIEWGQVASIGCSWIFSPILGAIGAFTLFSHLRSTIFLSSTPLATSLKRLPFIAGFVALVLSFSFHTSIGIPKPFFEAAYYSFPWAIGAFFIFRYLQGKLLPKMTPEESQHMQLMSTLMELEAKKQRLLLSSTTPPEELQSIEREIRVLARQYHPEVHSPFEEIQLRRVEKLFGVLQIVTACMMAFAHGANDVANAVGPLQACVAVLHVDSGYPLLAYPSSMLVLGGIGIVIGLATYGWKVIETIGRKITELTPSRGFSAEFAASLTILLATRLGFPISTTHTLVGAVLGVGMAGGLASINSKTIRDIILSWVITIPAGALFAITTFEVLKRIFA